MYSPESVADHCDSYMMTFSLYSFGMVLALGLKHHRYGVLVMLWQCACPLISSKRHTRSRSWWQCITLGCIRLH